MKKLKNIKKRMLSITLTIAIALTGVGISTLADTIKVNASSEVTDNESKAKNLITDKSLSQKDVKIPEVVKEIKSERTKNTNTYLLSDGTKKLEIFAENIRYKENGKWKNYNAEITKINENDKVLLEKMDVDGEVYIYTNTQGKYKHYFAETVNEENPVILTDDNYEIKFAPVKEEKTVAKENVTAKTNIETADISLEEISENTEIEQVENSADILSVEEIDEEKPLELTYSNESKSIEYEYISLNNGVKESIILNEKPESNVFEFKLDLEDLEAKVNKETNRIDLIDINTKKLKANIEAPNIIDKSGIADYDHVHYELKTDEEGGYILSVIVDKEYINNAEYPIKIDPTYTWINDAMIEYGATMSISGASSSVLNKASNITLMNGVGSKGRLYVKFKDLNEQLKGKYVYYSYFAAYTVNASGSIAIGASKVLGDWDENTLTWNTQPEISDIKYDVEATFTNDGINTYTLTQWTKEIAAGEINDDYGIALSCVGAENQNAFVNMYPLFTTDKLATFYVHYMDVEEVNSEYDGSFQMESEITDENKVELSWDKFSDDVCEYNIYVRTANKFNLIGRTTELEYTIDESYLGDYTDIRVMAIECGTDMAFYSAENYLSNIISIQKCIQEEPVTEDDITEPLGLEIDSLSSLDVNTLSDIGDTVENTTVTSYEQTILDTDGDELEDGYEIWDLNTLWSTETSESTEDNIIYDLDTDDDGFPDSYEVFTLGTDPAVANPKNEDNTNVDSDGDGWTDLREYSEGTDPRAKDSDFDGIVDKGDAEPRLTEGKTSQTRAADTVVHVGLYDREYSETEEGVTYTYITNIYRGNVKQIKFDNGNDKLNITMKYFYDEAGNNTAIVETYDETYDPNHTQTICITYTYNENNDVTFICDQETNYTMEYDTNGEMTLLKVGNQELVSYVNSTPEDNEENYDSLEIGALVSENEYTTIYGKSATEEVGRIKNVVRAYKVAEDDTASVETVEEVYYDGSENMSYKTEYTSDGNIKTFYDYTENIQTPITYNYTYSETGQTMTRSDGFSKTVIESILSEEESESSYISTSTTTYGFKNLKNEDKTYRYTETIDLGEDNLAENNIVLYNGDISSYSYDSEKNEAISKIYSNLHKRDIFEFTQTEVSNTEVTFNINLEGANTENDKDIDYIYDLAGNITQISINDEVKHKYTYDAHGRLTSEKDYVDSKYHEYIYNTTGNMDAHWTYSMDDNGTVSEDEDSVVYYKYTDSNWPDQLSKYNGHTITYDNLGNPTEYHNGLKFEWERGRQLAGIKNSDNTTEINDVTYKYNKDGLRIYKDTELATTTYEWDENTLIREMVTYKATNNTYDIWYFYDNNGEVIGFEYSCLYDLGEISTNRIYYEKDLQGNVIGLLDSSGTEIATYFYDAWGNITVSDYLEGYEIPFMLNHITYRSYYRDDESGFYYLQSRYYDAEVGRFISADDVNNLGTGNIVAKDNLYCYCNCDPVNIIDPSGRFGTPIQWAMAVVGGVVGWKFGDYVAKQLGYKSGWKYWSIRAGVTIGGSVIGWFAGSRLVKIVSRYLSSNPAVMAKVPNAVLWLLGLTQTKPLTASTVADLILSAKRVGSGLKQDLYHRAASWLTKAQLSKGKVYYINNGKRILLQTKGKLNGIKGIFEYIINENGEICHQFFKEGGKINGIPN